MSNYYTCLTFDKSHLKYLWEKYEYSTTKDTCDNYHVIIINSCLQFIIILIFRLFLT